MKILVLDQFSDPGGAQQALLDLLPAFHDAGWRAVVAMPGNGECFERVRDLGFGTARIACGPYRPDFARFAREAPRLAREIRRLAAGVDLIYVNGPRVLPGMALAGVDAPVVFHSHSNLKGSARALTRFCLRRMRARVIANCRFVAGQWGECEVVYNGVRAPSALGRPGGLPHCVGCIGRIAAEKGQREFVAAAARILKAAPDCRFLIFGTPLFGDSAYETEVRASARGLPVEFRGWTSDVYAALAELDVLLVPSAATEATTRVIPEAFAAGVPVVAFASGGIPELIEDGVNGFLAHSVEEMTQTAVRLLASDRAEVSRAARETWRRRFTLEIYRREVMRILNSTAALPASTAAPASTGP